MEDKEQLTPETTEKVETNQETKTYTQEDFDKALQAETDRKTTKALQTAKEKWEAEFKEKLEQEKSEAAKLASMSESERLQADFDKQKQEFENERKSFLRERMELQTVKELSSEGLPTSFSQYVIADTADDVKKNIAEFKTAWQSAIEEAVSERLKGKTPANSASKSPLITKEQFKKLGYAERAKLMETDPELYQELKNR